MKHRKIQTDAYDIFKQAMEKNKIRYITYDEFDKLKSDPMFMYVGMYVIREWKALENEVGIDGNTLERLVLKK